MAAPTPKRPASVKSPLEDATLDLSTANNGFHHSIISPADPNSFLLEKGIKTEQPPLAMVNFSNNCSLPAKRLQADVLPPANVQRRDPGQNDCNLP
jgi:hypothetical protein